MLRLTHLSRRRAHCWDDVPADGWYIRFTGDQDDWTDLKSQLKSVGWDIARWVATYVWDDDKEGAWWIDDAVFREVYLDEFSNLDSSMLDHSDDDVQWIYRWRRTRGWVGSHSHAWYQARNTQQKKQQAPCVPSWLVDDYRYLQLPEQAAVTSLEVKAAYRLLSKAYHPDTGGANDAFVRLHRAYEHVMSWVMSLEKQVS